ncbi:hypothetical protein [Streptosporangium sp. KLBMP 9127]|nr:hypothetical protein [Streptosporangium sp. KLBMP 9127]
MPTFDEEIRRLMADETARLQAAPDLLERVMRSSRSNRRRAWTAAVAASVAVIVAAPVAYLSIGSVTTNGEQATLSTQPTLSAAVPEPPPIDDISPLPSDPPNLGDLGDGKEFGHVKAGYLPEGLRWSHRSEDSGESYSTSYNYQGDKNGFYCVQIRVYEDTAVQQVDDWIQEYREKADGEQVDIGDRTGYLVVQNVGEDGMDGDPTLFLKMGDRQWAEIKFSPIYAKEFPAAEAVNSELKKIGQGLTSTI